VPIHVRLALALLAYAFLAMLVWRTMEPDKIRLVTFVILGLLALRTVTHAARMKREAAEERDRSLGQK
jgi:predicted membrane channel-forming protein YqfA (hemolysin III family)